MHYEIFHSSPFSFCTEVQLHEQRRKLRLSSPVFFFGAAVCEEHAGLALSSSQPGPRAPPSSSNVNATPDIFSASPSCDRSPQVELHFCELIKKKKIQTLIRQAYMC